MSTELIGIGTLEISVAIMVFGALLLILSIQSYGKMLRYMKSQAYEKKLFNHKIYGVAYILMIVFLLSYIVISVMMVAGTLNPQLLMIPSLLLFVSIFVCCIVRVMTIMMGAIERKTWETIQAVIDAVDAKDHYTQGHSEHVLKLVCVLYEHLSLEMKHKVNLVKLRDAAMLHDAGKIAIPDGVLNKTETLTDKDWAIIKQHPKDGKHLLEKTTYREIGDIVMYHHERMDGKGYYGITGEDIPIESRIIAIADVFSALYTDRVYRKRYPFEKCITILKESAGTHLDHRLVAVFCTISEEDINKLDCVFVTEEETEKKEEIA